MWRLVSYLFVQPSSILLAQHDCRRLRRARITTWTRLGGGTATLRTRWRWRSCEPRWRTRLRWPARTRWQRCDCAGVSTAGSEAFSGAARVPRETRLFATSPWLAQKVKLTKKMLEEAIDNVRGAVMICYPMGLPEFDPVRHILEGDEDLTGTSYANDPIDPTDAVIWYCGKQMDPEKKLSDHVGRNDKTKVVVKVQKKGSSAPAREPVVDEATHKAMLSWYHKRSEEQKKLEEDQDDQFVQSAWADNKSLKSHFRGTGDIRIR